MNYYKYIDEAVNRLPETKLLNILPRYQTMESVQELLNECIKYFELAEKFTSGTKKLIWQVDLVSGNPKAVNIVMTGEGAGLLDDFTTIKVHVDSKVMANDVGDLPRFFIERQDALEYRVKNLLRFEKMQSHPNISRWLASAELALEGFLKQKVNSNKDKELPKPEVEKDNTTRQVAYGNYLSRGPSSSFRIYSEADWQAVPIIEHSNYSNYDNVSATINFDSDDE
jgi:hypothetical protein